MSVANKIKEALKELNFTNRIPEKDSISKNSIEGILSELNNSYLNDDIVVDVLENLAFTYVLSNNVKDFRSKGIDIVAEEAKALLSSLPLEYKFLFPLPKSDDDFLPIKLRETIIIRRLTEDMGVPIKDTALTGIMGHIESLKGPIIDKGTIVLEITGRGYVTKYDGPIDIDMEDPLFIYRCILAYCDLANIFDNASLPYLPPSSLPSYVYYCFTSSKIVSSHETDIEDHKLTRERKFKTGMLLKGSPFIKNLTSVIKTNSSSTKAYKKEQGKIRNALFWWYEARKTKLYYYKIITIMSAFDALLATNNEAKEYKALRVAQITSSTFEGESTMATRIKSLYELRNNIVHGSKQVSSISRHTKQGREDIAVAQRGWIILCLFIMKRAEKL